MQSQTREATDEKPFVRSHEVFDHLTKRLSSGAALEMTHGELERMLDEEGRALLRQLLQDHLDLRGPGRAMTDVVGARSIRRPHERLRTRSLKTIFGEVAVSRVGYSAHGADTLFPKDAELNLPPELYSHGLQRRAATEVIKGSFDQAAAAIAEVTGTSVPKRQVEQLAARAAEDFDAFYESREEASAREVRNTGDVLVLSTDGKGVVMRRASLREATRQAAEARTNKLSKRLSRGEKRGSKRMAQVATVYTIAPFVRRPEDIVKDFAPVQQVDAPAKRPRPEHKRVWASLDKEPKAVIEQMFAEAHRRDPNRTKHWAALVDGNPSQLALIKKAARHHGAKPTIIVDIIHVLEYLWGAGFALHGEGESKAERWVSERLLEVLRGNSSDVAAGMRRSATMRAMSAADRKAVDSCADYLLKYRQYLRYDQYLAAGLPIATGVIEGACRHLVKDRMDITGARWGLVGAEAVLKLRAIRSSGDFDGYWAFHERAEHERNHLTLYRGQPPATVPPVKLTGRPRLRIVN